ncbi:SET and MYND domain-containing protein 5 isoform X2 [Zootermopsis nevadensis]|nr:SET and MYND domain-containing protein 5 isoform X2 [Zootermopsis nevadensis]
MRPLEGAQENVRRLTGKKDLVLPYPQCCPTNKESHTQCPSCGVQYCSTICKDQAWNLHHRTLCLQSHSRNVNHPLEQLNETWKYMHYPPETASVMILARMIATVQQAEDPASALNMFMQFCHRTVNEEEAIAHKLLGEQFRRQLEVLRELISLALYSDIVHQWLLPDGFQSLVALVGTNGQGVGTSPFSEWVRKVSELELPTDDKQQLDSFIDKVYEDLNEEVGSFLNSEGSALYALQSVCNHSCDPNAMPSFPHSNFQLAMCAVRDIAPGDEILISYLDECVLERSRHSRLKLLRENYIFTCHCSKCETQAGDLDVTSEDESDDEVEDDGGG